MQRFVILLKAVKRQNLEQETFGLATKCIKLSPTGLVWGHRWGNAGATPWLHPFPLSRPVAT